MSALEKSDLHREIHEQPDVTARLLQRERENAGALAAEMQRRGIGGVVIAARGTSDNAARYAQYLLAAANGLVVGLATPSLFTVYKTPPRFGNLLVMGISQSGKSPDIVSVIAEGKGQGALTAAITDFPDSDLGRTADYVIDLSAGEENSIAATKTYTAELAAIALLSVALGGDAGRSEMLDKIPGQVAQALEVQNQIAQVAERYRYMQSCVVVGRGYNYATAFELSLKLKELTYTWWSRTAARTLCTVPWPWSRQAFRPSRCPFRRDAARHDGLYAYGQAEAGGTAGDQRRRVGSGDGPRATALAYGGS